MPTLPLQFPRLTGPAIVRYTTTAGETYHDAFLAEGVTAEAYAATVAESICDVLNAAATERLEEGEELADPWVPAESYALTPLQVAEARYLSRASSSVGGRVMARWAAYNDVQLSSGAWAPEDFATFLPQALGVSGVLNTLAFGTAAQMVADFDHILATPEAKAHYLAVFAEEWPEGNL